MGDQKQKPVLGVCAEVERDIDIFLKVGLIASLQNDIALAVEAHIVVQYQLFNARAVNVVLLFEVPESQQFVVKHQVGYFAFKMFVLQRNRANIKGRRNSAHKYCRSQFIKIQCALPSFGSSERSSLERVLFVSAR